MCAISKFNPQLNFVSAKVTDIAYFQELLGRGAEEDGDPGLTHGGRRISV